MPRLLLIFRKGLPHKSLRKINHAKICTNESIKYHLQADHLKFPSREATFIHAPTFSQ